MALEETEAADESGRCCQCGKTARFGCIVGRSRVGATAACAPAAQVATTPRAEVHAALLLDRPLRHSSRAFYCVRRRGSRSSTPRRNAHGRGHDRSFLPPHTPEDRCEDSDSFSSCVCVCTTYRAYNSNSILSINSSVWNLRCDVISDVDGLVGGCDYSGASCRRRGKKKGSFKTSSQSVESCSRYRTSFRNNSSGCCSSYLAGRSNTAPINTGSDKRDYSEVATF